MAFSNRAAKDPQAGIMPPSKGPVTSALVAMNGTPSWMKRIAVNESLMFLRKKKNFNISVDVYPVDIKEKAHGADELLFEKYILVLLEQLPTGYRTIFNLYVIEGYKHREIAEKLGISINTSKSQLILAKKRMSELLKKNSIAEAS